MHPELTSDLNDRARPIDHPPNCLLLELRRILHAAHDNPFDQAPYPACPENSGRSRCPQAIRGPVGEGGAAMTVASFIASQRTDHRGSPRGRLSGLGGERVVVLKVERPAAAPAPGATG